MRKMLLVAASAAAVFSLEAHAQGFIGVAGGVSNWSDDACGQAASSCDHRGGTWLIRGGYMFLPYIGIEARYVDLGRSSFTNTFTANGGPASQTSHFESKGGAIGVVGAWPIAADFALVGVAGASRLKTSFDVPGTVSTSDVAVITTPGFHADETKTKPYFGIGVDYLVARNLSAGVEATRYRGTFDIDTLTASLTFHFR